MYDEMQRERGSFESYWEEIAAAMWPNMRNTFRAGSYKSPGQRNYELQMDSTPQIALHRFAAIMTSLLTPPVQKWHNLRPTDPALGRVFAVQEWFETANDLLFRYRTSHESRFAAQNRLAYLGLGALGTTAMFIDRLRGNSRGLRYKNIHVGEMFIRENHQGEVDTVLRRFTMTARQAVQRQEWLDKLPGKITEAAKNRPDETFTFFHVVRPRSDHDPQAIDARALPFESVYVAEADKTVLETGGFRSMPYAVSRYEQAPGEVYGRSPAMQAFPAIKTLMAQKRVVLTQGHRAVNPILLTADDGVISEQLRPGALVSSGVNQDGRPLVQPLPVGDVNLGRDMMEDERLIINDTFLVSLFQILVETPDRKTATEVIERVQEKGQLLAPTVGQQHDYLGLIIQRELDVLAEQGLLPPMPQELVEAAGEYKVEYDNPLTRAARAGEVAGLFRFMESVLPYVQITGDTSPFDHINWDSAAPEIAEISSVPVRWRNSVEKVAEQRQARAQQQQQQMAAQAAPGQAALIKAAADAKSKGLDTENL